MIILRETRHTPKKTSHNSFRYIHAFIISFLLLISIPNISFSQDDDLKSADVLGHKAQGLNQEGRSDGTATIAKSVLPDHTPVIAVFPLHNTAGRPDIDWLSIGLQDSLTVDLWYVSALNTKPLAAFPITIKEHCPAMKLTCVPKMKKTEWQSIAEWAGLDWFFWGDYRQEGEVFVVDLRLYKGPSCSLEGETNGAIALP